jgi:hypothetical protein
MDLSLRRVLTYIEHRRNQRVRLDPENHAPLLALLAFLSPAQARGHRKTRVGSSRDGGYVMVDDFEEIKAALSLGIGPDVSWDYAIAEKGIPVWQYDHTVSGPPREHPLFHFENKQIVAQGNSHGTVTLTSLLEGLDGKDYLLKMDIEGDEWEILAKLDTSLLSRCRQIVVELHQFLSIKDPEWRALARQALADLTRNFGVVHVHGNNLSKHIILDHVHFPDSLEVTFVNRRFYELEPTTEAFPGPHDRSNNPFFPDFNLGRFSFPHPSHNQAHS